MTHMRVGLALSAVFLMVLSPFSTVSLRAQTSQQIPTHIPTWAYDEYFTEGADTPPDQVRRYLTYAEGGLGNLKAQKDCAGSDSCYTVFYFNPHLIYASSVCPNRAYAGFIAAASENWYVHLSGYTDAAHRVRGTYTIHCKSGTDNEPVYVANDANPAVQAYFASYLQRNADEWNYYFMDDTGATVFNQTYGPGGGFCKGVTATGYCQTTQEFTSDEAVVQGHGALANALNHTNGSPMKFFYNGVSFQGDTAHIEVLGASNRFVGAVCEGCVLAAGKLRPTMYRKVLTAMARVDRLPGAQFVELSTSDAAPGSSDEIGQRLTITSVAWLGFSDGHTIVWPNLEYNTKNLAVWPEDQIYPSRPLESMSGSADDIAIAPGVWRREFAACYNNGSAIGPCAAILNANATPVVVRAAWLRQSYGHSVQLNGGDTPSGGTVSLSSTSFSPNQTSVPPGQGVLLVR
jgi:hypothetical protein